MANLKFLLVLLSLLAGAIFARGELVLTNFSAANPIKIMAVGDSITDDCSTNGAWRSFLQPLLESNGYAFSFIGRQSSVPALPGFTQTRHEAYCGAVCGAPGVMTTPVHGYAGSDVYLYKTVRDALTNLSPDLVLVMIGANDIGRGRQPAFVATNSMNNLLNLIYSYVPNAQVIFGKATTLQDAAVSGYSAFATNMPVFNSRLQTFVNQRRAAGKNVFLADFFSVVDNDTMFLSDHLHPNALGLRAIAQEWLTRIETITVRPDRVSTVLINGGANWRYHDQGQDLGLGWAQPGFDDSGWSNSPARLGYGDLSLATTVRFGPDATNRYVTTYFRRAFTVPWSVTLTNLNLRLARADGAVVWLNGQEVFRTNLPAGPIGYGQLALNAVTGFAAHVFAPVNFAATLLTGGTNLLAVEIHKASPTNSVLGFDLELIGQGNLIASPALSIAPIGGQAVLNWPASGGGFSLYSTTNPANASSWTTSVAPRATNGGQIVVTQTPGASATFYRLQRP